MPKSVAPSDRKVVITIKTRYLLEAENLKMPNFDAYVDNLKKQLADLSIENIDANSRANKAESELMRIKAKYQINE